jgi:hypothetical protein
MLKLKGYMRRIKGDGKITKEGKRRLGKGEIKKRLMRDGKKQMKKKRRKKSILTSY